MSTADAAPSQFGLELPEQHPDAENNGGPDAQRHRDDSDKSSVDASSSGQASLQSAMVLLMMGLEAGWVGFLIYLAHRLFT